jgi:hypothetical protein
MLLTGVKDADMTRLSISPREFFLVFVDFGQAGAS